MAFQNFPYSDFHEMNMDWIIQIVKEVKALSGDTAIGLEELKKYVEEFFTDLNVQSEINNKLDEMNNDGTLANIINEQIFTELNSELDELNSELDGLSDSAVRFDNNYSEFPVSVFTDRYMDTDIYITRMDKARLKPALVPANGSFTAPGTNMGTVYGATVVNKPQVSCNAGYGKLYGFNNGTYYLNTAYPTNKRNSFVWFDANNNLVGAADLSDADANITNLQSLGATKNCSPVLGGFLIKERARYPFYGHDLPWIVDEVAPRTVLADDDDYVYIFTALGRMSGQRGIDLKQMQDYLWTKYDLKTAANLDGGGVVQCIVGGMPLCPIMDFYTASLTYPGRPTISAWTFNFESEV